MKLNTVQYLLSRGWRIFRKRIEGQQARYISPYEPKIYTQREAYKIEKSRSAA